MIQGEVKEAPKAKFEPASSHHKFDKNHIALRKLYKDICINNKNSFYEDKQLLNSNSSAILLKNTVSNEFAYNKGNTIL
jgi:hypothetical protein